MITPHKKTGLLRLLSLGKELRPTTETWDTATTGDLGHSYNGRLGTQLHKTV